MFAYCKYSQLAFASSLVLDENGGVYAFGNGKTGCLGLGDFESQMLPVRISTFGASRICIGICFRWSSCYFDGILTFTSGLNAAQ